MHTACAVKARRPVSRPHVVLTATLEELTAKLQRMAAIKSMKATVAIQLSVVAQDQASLREFRDTRAFILIRRPEWIQVQALVPVVGSTAIDMLSDGDTFQVLLPTRNQLFAGRNQIVSRSEKRIENIRPQHLLQALLIDPPMSDERPMLVNRRERAEAYQVVQLIRELEGALKISREIWFDRSSLEIARLVVFDEQADTVTDARYREWSEQDSLPFAQWVSISRPQDGYDLNIHVLKPGLNETIPDDRFVLSIPSGVEVKEIGAAAPAAAVRESEGVRHD